MARGTSYSNHRGSAETRRRRRAWVMETWASDVDGFVRCYRCGKLLNGDMTLDRIQPGRHGGRYTRDNIRPACMLCNQKRG